MHSIKAVLPLLLWQGADAAPKTLAQIFTSSRDKLFEFAPKIMDGAIKFIIVFVVFYLVAVIGKRLITYTTSRLHSDKAMTLLIARVYYYGILLFGVITALGTTGMDISALVTGLGLTGFALGFALKDVLSNLLAGLMLLVYRPFQIGDHIVMGAYEGSIETIRMRDTVLRGLDGRFIIIPNTKLITEVVVNSTGSDFKRESVGIDVASIIDVDRARELFAQAAAQLPNLAGRIEPFFIINKINDQLTRVESRFWVDEHHADKAVVKAEVAGALKKAFDDAANPSTALRPARPLATNTATTNTDSESEDLPASHGQNNINF